MFDFSGTTDLLMLETFLVSDTIRPVRGTQKRNILNTVPQAMVSSIDGINQTNDSQQQPTAMHQFRKELSICPSLQCLDLVSFSSVVSSNATDATPGGALPSIPLSVSLATRLSRIHKH